MDKDKSGPFFLVKSVAPIKNTKIKSTKVTVEKIDIGAPQRASSAHLRAPHYRPFVFFCSLIFFLIRATDLSEKWRLLAVCTQTQI